LENDEERGINTDWFYREVVVNALGKTAWQSLEESQREELNRALLRFDPSLDVDATRFRSMAPTLGLDEPIQERLMEAWKKRPNLKNCLKLSRRAVRNLIPYMEEVASDGHWRTQLEARVAFAAQIEARLNVPGLTSEERRDLQQKRER